MGTTVFDDAITIEDETSFDWPEPDMSLAAGARRPAPRFTIEIFAPALKDWIARTAEGAGAPPDYVALTLLSVVAAVIGNSRRVSAWESWIEPLVIWTMIVGFPGDGKSPARDAILDALRTLEKELAEDFSTRLREWATAKAEAKARHERWEASVTAAVKAGDAAPILPADAVEPERPERRRFQIQDATPEKMARLLAVNPRGILISRDELAAWIEAFGRYHGGGKGGSERAMYTEAFGARLLVIDRVKDVDGPIIIEHFFACISGGTQPDRLVEMLLRGSDDGFTARFLYAWPEPVAPTRPHDFSSDSILLNALRRLYLLPFARDHQGHEVPLTITLEEPAVERFHAWRIQHDKKIRLASGFYSSWLAKQFGYVLRLAAVLEFPDWSVGLIEKSAPLLVSLATVERAITFVDDYLSPMAERVFGDAALPDDERGAANIAKLVVARRLGDLAGNGRVLINSRAVQRLKLPKLRSADAVKAAFAVLTENGWLRPAPSRVGERGGRRREDHEVNPYVFKGSSQ